MASSDRVDPTRRGGSALIIGLLSCLCLECGDGKALRPGASAPVAVTDARLSAGSSHTCVVQPDRTLWCWGGNGYGQLGDGTLETRSTPVRVGVEADWRAVSAGASYEYGCRPGPTGGTTCAIRAGGRLFCWGDNFVGQLGDGTFESRVVPTAVAPDKNWATVSVSAFQTCAVEAAGALSCWGGVAALPNTYGCVQAAGPSSPRQVGTESDWSAVAVGTFGGCGLRRDGTLWCWSREISADRDAALAPLTPVRMGAESDWTAIAVGGERACGVRANATAWCWPIRGAVPSWTEPQPVSASTGRQAISPGARSLQSHACQLGTDGRLACWGWNEWGQLGSGDLIQQRALPDLLPVGGAPGWTAVSAGGSHTCGRRDDGTLWCWGSNVEGRLGIGVAAEKALPARADGDNDWIGVDTRCGIRADGTLHCWGKPHDQPEQVGAEGGWVRFAGNCGIRTGDRLWCRDKDGVPYRVDADEGRWVDVSGTDNFTCGLHEGGLFCFGMSRVGTALLRGTVAPPLFLRVEGDSRSWSSVDTASYSGCGIRSDGTLWCWPFPGSADDGQLLEAPRPRQVGVGGGWEMVSVGDDVSCGLRGGGQLFCWSARQPEPTQLSSETWRSVGVGSGGGCGITTAGALACWTGTQVSTVSPLGGWVQVRVAADHACALREDGTRWCWGDNLDGQLGDGSAWRAEPARVALPPP